MPYNSQIIEAINQVGEFLAQNATTPIIDTQRETVFVLAGNAVLPITRALFDYLSDFRISRPVTLVLCGGIGHSTNFLREAIERSFNLSQETTANLAEARILEIILNRYYPKLISRIQRGEIQLLVEDQSTNCGSNTIETVKILDLNNIEPEVLVLVQDPTMMRRTIAGFEKIFESSRKSIDLIPWSTFTPRIRLGESNNSNDIAWGIGDWFAGQIDTRELWTFDRYFDLIMGEIPRMKDDQNGYGPAGKGFIAHVDIPQDVINSWAILKGTLHYQR